VKTTRDELSIYSDGKHVMWYRYRMMNWILQQNKVYVMFATSEKIKRIRTGYARQPLPYSLYIYQ